MMLPFVRKLDLLQYAFSLNFYFSMFSFLTHSLICHLPETLKIKDCKKMIYSDSRKGLKLFYDLRSLSSFLD